MISKLKEVRESKGLTQEQLAVLVQVSRQSIISIEKGHYIPTTILALKISQKLNIAVEDLFTLQKIDWK